LIINQKKNKILKNRSYNYIKNKMPRHQYIGKQTDKVDKYIETNVSFGEIVNHAKMKQIRKPNYQGSLIEEKVEKMIEEYLENKLLLKFKNRIIIGCLKNNWYIIDGQHRIEMARQLYESHQIEDKLVFCWYLCESEEEMKQIFQSVNNDSLKNQYYVSDQDIQQIIKEEFTGKLKQYHNTHFAKKKSVNGQLKTIEEFVIDLDNINFFKGIQNSQEAYDILKKHNEKFFHINRYKIDLQTNGSTYYAPEKKILNDNIVFSLKRNNFIEWVSDNNIEPFHNKRNIKANISAYKRKQVWKKEFGDSEFGCCPISWCQTILKNGVKNGFQCGHIISEYNGGETKVDNLRPICPGCNQSMGRKNWSDWEQAN
jgi:hypothetical protein